MTPEEYAAHIESLKGQHDELFQSMESAQPEEDGVESGRQPIPEPDMPAPAEAEVAETGVEVQANEIPEPPAMAVAESPSGYPDAQTATVQTNDIPEPPQEAPQQDVEGFIHQAKSQWLQAQGREQPEPPDYDLREDAGMPDVGNMRQDLDDFAINMTSSYRSVEDTFAVLSDVTGSHSRNVQDILARLMRQRLP